LAERGGDSARKAAKLLISFTTQKIGRGRGTIKKKKKKKIVLESARIRDSLTRNGS